MNDLQIGLTFLGVLLILIVLAFNWWQNRRVRNKMRGYFPPGPEAEGVGEMHSMPAGAAAGMPGGIPGGISGSMAGVSGGAPGSMPRSMAGATPGSIAAGIPGGTSAGMPGSVSGNASGGIFSGFGAAKAADISRSEPSLGAVTQPLMPPPNLIADAYADEGDEVDPVCEVVIEVAFTQPVLGAALFSATQNLRATGTKAIRLFGQTATQYHHTTLYPNEPYIALQIAVLLANRSGPLNAIEWSQAWARAQYLAECFEGTIEGPDQRIVLDRAAKLDASCAALDAQVVLTLLLNEAQLSVELFAVACDMGFVPEGHSLTWMSEEGDTCFSLMPTDASNPHKGFDATQSEMLARLDLLLDVPRTTPDAHAFTRMVEVGRRLGQRLGGQLVDEQGKALSEHSLPMLDQHLQIMFEKLEQAGFHAGSARARRVFG